MADSRRAKLQRLSDFRRSMPHVSGRAFSSVLQHIRDHGLPELMTRRHQREARDITTYQDTPYGTIVETVQLLAADGGAPYKLELVNPLALLHHASATPGNFTSFFQSRLVHQPRSPFALWHIALYSDGITSAQITSGKLTQYILASWNLAVRRLPTRIVGLPS